MKRIALTLFTASTLLIAGNSFSQKKDSKGKWIPIDSAMMNKAWAESMTITKQHEMLAKTAGTWDADITMWMAPGEAPIKSTSSTENTMIYNGLYQLSKHSGSMMGAPFEGMSTTGYDNTLKKYVSTWIDNMGSGILIMTGNWDDATKTINLSGSMKNPANGLDCHMREVFKITDDNNHTMEMYGPDPATGKEMKTMEIKYTRKK